MKTVAKSIIIILLISICQVAWAQGATEDFKKGHDFFKNKKYIDAVEWFRKAAEQGYVAAQYGIGKFYRDGKCGFTEDSNEAVKWFRKAAEQGLVEAQYDLAVCYASGDGVTESYEEAAKWFHKAAEQGHSTSQLFLGIGYWKGEGLPQNIEEAKKWLGKAAEQGNGMAKQALEQLQKEIK